MEAIAPHALVIKTARQGEGVGDEGMGAVEGGVEAGDLRRFGESVQRRVDPSQIVRLVQGRQRLEIVQMLVSWPASMQQGLRSNRGRHARRDGRRR